MLRLLEFWFIPVLHSYNDLYCIMYLNLTKIIKPLIGNDSFWRNSIDEIWQESRNFSFLRWIWNFHIWICYSMSKMYQYCIDNSYVYRNSENLQFVLSIFTMSELCKSRKGLIANDSCLMKLSRFIKYRLYYIVKCWI